MLRFFFLFVAGLPIFIAPLLIMLMLRVYDDYYDHFDASIFVYDDNNVYDDDDGYTEILFVVRYRDPSKPLPVDATWVGNSPGKAPIVVTLMALAQPLTHPGPEYWQACFQMVHHQLVC